MSYGSCRPTSCAQLGPKSLWQSIVFANHRLVDAGSTVGLAEVVVRCCCWLFYSEGLEHVLLGV